MATITNWIVKQNLISEFVDHNIESIDWVFVSQFRTLTSSQMVKYARLINWELASEHQKISKNLAKQLIHLVHIDILQKHQPHLSIGDIFQLKIAASL